MSENRGLFTLEGAQAYLAAEPEMVVEQLSDRLFTIGDGKLRSVFLAGDSSVIAFDVMRPPPKCLTPNQTLPDVLPTLLTSEMLNVPVVNNLAQFRLVGTITRSEALSLLSEAISARSTPYIPPGSWLTIRSVSTPANPAKS